MRGRLLWWEASRARRKAGLSAYFGAQPAAYAARPAGSVHPGAGSMRTPSGPSFLSGRFSCWLISEFRRVPRLLGAGQTGFCCFLCACIIN